MSESNLSGNIGAGNPPPFYPGAPEGAPGENVPSPWPSRLWTVLKIVIVFALFIIYAGYAHRSGSAFGGDPTFVDSPGFTKFSESSGISGLINLASGMWGRALGIEAPLDKDSVGATSGEMADEVVVLSFGDEGMMEEDPVEKMVEVVEEEVALEEQEPVETVTDPSDAKASNCPKIPDVPWWANKTKNEAQQYVNSKYGGDWKPYIAKWENHLTKVIDVYVAGKKAMIKETETILNGEDLADYVDQIEERISVIHCFARNTASIELPS